MVLAIARNRIDARAFGFGVFFVLLMLLSAFIGLLVATGNYLLFVPLFALGAATMFAITPPTTSLVLLFVLTFLVVGPVMYFLKIEMVRWVPPLMGVAMLVPYIFLKFKRQMSQHAPVSAPAFVWWFLVFYLVLGFSTFSTEPRFSELATGWRNYLAYLPVAMLMAAGAMRPAAMHWIWKFLIFCAFAQLPVVFYQHFFVASQSAWSSSWDAVVGTFPGNAEASGASHALGLFVLSALVVCGALWRQGKAPLWLFLALAASTLATLALAEVKGVVLLIPVAFGLLYIRELLRRPVLVTFSLLVAIASIFIIFKAYDSFYYIGSFRPSDAPSSPIEAIQNQMDETKTSQRGYELSRAGLVSDWWARNIGRRHDFSTAFGYGIGATQFNARLGAGELYDLLPYRNLNMTGTSILLWETGLLGHGLFVTAMLAAALCAARLSTRGDIPDFDRAALQASATIIALLAIALPYKGVILETPPTQLLFFFALGYTLYWHYRSSAQKNTK